MTDPTVAHPRCPDTPTERHHAAPQCLLRLRDEAEGELRLAGVGAWLEFELEAERWGVPVEIARADLQRLVAASTEVISRERHRLLHASDWQRWGRRGGQATLRRYGSEWYVLLALRRWGRISAADLEAARPLR
jgi:NAD-dependent oxidoreductase involved in siderophore biosynthesis